MGPSWSLAAITPCYPSPPSQAWGHNCLEEEEEKEREEKKKEEKQEKEEKKCHYPLALLPLPTILALWTQLPETLLAHHHLIPLDADHKYTIISKNILKYQNIQNKQNPLLPLPTNPILRTQLSDTSALTLGSS